MAYWRHCDVYFQRPKIIERQSMTIENFQALIEAHSLRRPFHPFTIELTDGQRFEVDHPLALAYRDNLAFFISPGAVPHWFDHESVSTILGDTANSAA